ncbi:MAG: oligosaccharide flippase family protein [Acidobacteriota bacterium]
MRTGERPESASRTRTDTSAPLKGGPAGFGGRQSLLASGGLSLAASVWSTAVALVTVPVMVHGLGLTSYGIYSVAFSVAALGSYLDLGLGWTTAKFVAEADATTSRTPAGTAMAASAIYQLSLGIVFAAVVIIAASPICVVILHLPSNELGTASAVLRLTAVSFVASSQLGVFVSTLRGLRRFSAATLIATASTTISAIGAAGAASMGLGIVAAAVAQLFGVACGVVAGVAACYTLLRAADYGQGLWRQLRAMLGFSIWNYASRLIQMFVLQADKIVIARWGGPAVLAFYSVPFNFAQRVNVLAGPAVTAIYPIAVVGRLDRESFMRQYLAASRLIHVATAALAIAVLVWGDRFLAAWVGPEMASRGTLFLRALTVGFWAVSVGSFDGGCIEGWNKPQLIFALSAGAAVVGLAIVATAMWAWQRPDAAVALGVAGYFVAVGIGQMVVWYRISRYPLSFMFRRVALPVAEMGLLGVIASIGLRRAIEGRVMSIVTLFCLMAGLAAYGVPRAMSRAELRTLAGRVLSPFGAA